MISKEHGGWILDPWSEVMEPWKAPVKFMAMLPEALQGGNPLHEKG